VESLNGSWNSGEFDPGLGDRSQDHPFGARPDRGDGRDRSIADSNCVRARGGLEDRSDFSTTVGRDSPVGRHSSSGSTNAGPSLPPQATAAPGGREGDNYTPQPLRRPDDRELGRILPTDWGVSTEVLACLTRASPDIWRIPQAPLAIRALPRRLARRSQGRADVSNRMERGVFGRPGHGLAEVYLEISGEIAGPLATVSG
jgi:hypothetical protein